jgi:hypothetical protein
VRLPPLPEPAPLQPPLLPVVHLSIHMFQLSAVSPAHSLCLLSKKKVVLPGFTRNVKPRLSEVLLEVYLDNAPVVMTSMAIINVCTNKYQHLSSCGQSSNSFYYIQRQA